MSNMDALKREFFERSYGIVSKVTRPTKLIYSDFLSQRTGGRIYLKPENLQVTGSYKVRGAYYKMSTLSSDELSRGVITASAGNHAQGVAYAARCFNANAVIVMPSTTPYIKVRRTEEYGAKVLLFGDVYDDAYAKALELSKEHGCTFIHPFDDLSVAAGQGTIAMEIFADLPLVDLIILPIGGGGLAAGVSTLSKMLNPSVGIIGVEPEHANSMQESLKAGHVVTLPSIDTIADGTAVRTPGESIFPYIQKNVERVMTVPDSELVTAFLDIVENHKMIVENAGLLSVAALSHLDLRGKNVVAVLSGGNMDIITMSSVVQNGLILRDRIFTVSVSVPDKPGELTRVTNVCALERGNIIRLTHNQFVAINRSAGVEVKITMEAFGTDHKDRIIAALKDAGYDPKQVSADL